MNCEVTREIRNLGCRGMAVGVAVWRLEVRSQRLEGAIPDIRDPTSKRCHAGLDPASIREG